MYNLFVNFENKYLNSYSMKKLKWIIILLVFIIGATYSFNYFTLAQPTKLITDIDTRNEGIKFDPHYKYFVLTSTLVFDLKDVPSDKAIADVFRVFLQTASALKEKEYTTVELSFKGVPKFTIKGDYFSLLGKEYGDQNPVYTMRTFSEHLNDMSGQLAYSEWNGGLLGVIGKQMEDFKDFHNKWYINDLGQ